MVWNMDSTGVIISTPFAASLLIWVPETEDEDFCSIRIFIPVGVMCVPILVKAQLDVSGTFICENKDILNEIKKWVDDYIHDLYASNIECPILNETEVFYVDKKLEVKVVNK